MPSEKQILCWITRRPAKFESQRFEAVCHTLRQHDWEIHWVEAPQSLNEESVASWLNAKVPANCSAVFFGDKDLTWFKTILLTIRGLKSSHIAYVPFFWVYEDVDHHLLALMREEGFNDFFHTAVKPHELLLRIRMRQQEMEDRFKLEQRMKEENVRNARNETILKQREEFLSVCAHDLRSPLGLIQSSAGMMLKSHSGKGTLAPTDHEFLTRIKRQAEQALSLVGDLLDVMSFEQGLQPQYRLLKLDDLLGEFYRDYSTQAEQKKVSFHYENQVPDWRVLADSDRIRQLLQNLFSNALKYTDSGKNIFLTVSSFQGRRKHDPPYPMIIITVKDEGKGIPPRELQRIFDRFSQIKEHSKPEGRGLGLTVAKQISNLHDGNVWVESQEGTGSTFYALFPHVISAPQINATPRQTPVVVIAEPSLDRRSSYFREWEGMGLEVHFAKDGADALALIHYLRPDAYVLTANLPKIDPAEVLNLVKSEPAIAQTPGFLAADENEKVESKFETHKFERVIRLPATKSEIELTLKSVGKGIPKKAA